MAATNANPVGDAYSPVLDIGRAPVMKTAPMYPGLKIAKVRNGSAETTTPSLPRPVLSDRFQWVYFHGIAGASLWANLFETLPFAYAKYAVKHDHDTDAGKATAKELLNNALLMHAVRVAATVSYEIEGKDIMTDELAAAIIRATQVNGSWTFSAPSNLVDVSPTSSKTGYLKAYKFAIDNIATIPEEFVEAVTYVGAIAPAIPVLQGWSLVGTNHHFLPTTARAYRTAWKQITSGASDKVKNRCGMVEADWEDLLYHKACHPINMTLKKAWAQSLVVKDILNAGGLQGATVRLPAIPVEAMIIKSGPAVIRKARNPYIAMGRDYNLANADELLIKLETAKTDDELHETIARCLAWGRDNEQIIAEAAGIVYHIVDTSGKSVALESTLTAKSVNRITGQHSAQYAAGQVLGKLYLQSLDKVFETASVQKIDL